MASAIFVVPFVVAKGPDIDMMTLLAEGVVEGYGWSVLGHVPQADTCLVRVWTSDTILDTLATNPDFLFVEDIDG